MFDLLFHERKDMDERQEAARREWEAAKAKWRRLRTLALLLLSLILGSFVYSLGVHHGLELCNRIAARASTP